MLVLENSNTKNLEVFILKPYAGKVLLAPEKQHCRCSDTAIVFVHVTFLDAFDHYSINGRIG